MKEADLTEALDDRQLLAASRGPGCYALECAVPDTVAEVESVWANHHDVDPPDGYLDRLAAANRVAYVGASTNVYTRLCDHVTHAARETVFVEMFPVRDVVDVWPGESPFEREFNRAAKLAERDDWAVWTNGEILG